MRLKVAVKLLNWQKKADYDIILMDIEMEQTNAGICKTAEK